MGIVNDREKVLEVFSLLMYLTSRGKYHIIRLKYIVFRNKFTYIHIWNGFSIIFIYSSPESGTTASNNDDI